ncbi:MAG: peptidase M50 [Candidatus Thiodiazotropha lotti]|uniref:Peptidase M50 n=1 Tax=Candidatus Thiodiazotropha lotti TaxID=2792787 RepID=A0A9E4N1C2_9GAMM|nr:peptidase M50 [Candidatus Thiodiazotropha lotti]MCG7920535.1 peptidase M50 [Candidatus Thiodiazotropha lotti]MCG7930579.1 peptidase M50 [Candidatus Thiodiazotropha lotti]MCG7940143.1 peptidase M50 [Candidatus Thiodiazotropha lotti]MCG7988344.1 peptidase M50 [Candidatus Thiodiazotropha lotti]
MATVTVVALVGLMEALWQKVAGARPSLNPQIVIRRQRYLGETWYLLQDPISERHFRISPGAYHLISRFDGKLTLEEIWHRREQRQLKPPAQDEFIQLLSQLQSSGVLMHNRDSEVLQILERRKQPRQWLQQLRNPLALRLPLWDPDRILSWSMPLIQPLFSRIGMGLWLLLVLSGLLQAVLHWQEISHNITSQLLSADNLLLMGAVYLLMKLFHEAAHGFATKHWGGEVHQVGVLFLAFIPMPYVDASAANGFSERWARISVGAAGIMTELLLASLGLWLWLVTGPGWLNAAAYNMMLIGGLSTLLVNGNPLLKFDGYYVFSDLIDIPNLYQRANRYLGYLLQHYLYNLEDAKSPAHNDWERSWFLFYGIAAFCYRWFILITIMLFVAEAYPLVGWAIALWALTGMVILPLIRQLSFLLTSPRLAIQRRRAILSSAAICGSLLLILFVLPAPHATHAEGIILPPDGTEVRSGTTGEVVELLTAADTQVRQNQPLVALEDPFIETEIKRLASRLRGMRAEYEALVSERKRVKAEILSDEIHLAETELLQQRQLADRLLLLSPAEGTFLLQQPGDLPGRFINQGELIGYVQDKRMPEIRVAISQQDIGLVRSATRNIKARYAHNPESELAVTLLQEIPESRQRLPSPALSSLGGGEFSLHPEDVDGTRPLTAVFEMRLQLRQQVARLGERVIVRFEHPSEPLGRQWYRSLRQMFLKRFSI